MAIVAALMTRDVVCGEPGDTLESAFYKMQAHRISSFVVCEAGFPVGIITERDMARLALEMMHGARDVGFELRTVMSTPVTTVHEEATISAALRTTNHHGIRHIPVVDSAGRLVGILTQTDLLRAYTKEVETVVLERTQELRHANQQLQELAVRDPLTGVGNRRSMEENLERMHCAALRYQRPYSVILCDIDHFKQFNDRYGHLAGDAALRDVASTLVKTLRRADHVYRYGGEEMLLVLPETTADKATDAAGRVRASVEALALPHAGSPFGYVTISGGIAGVEDCHDGGWRNLVQRADAALYEAKERGRNAVVLAPALAPPAGVPT